MTVIVITKTEYQTATFIGQVIREVESAERAELLKPPIGGQGHEGYFASDVPLAR